MRHNLFEVIVGAFVLLAAAFFFISSVKQTGFNQSSGYQISAGFDNIDGVTSGSDVKMSGVKIGAVENQTIDPQTYRAKLVLNIRNDIKLPVDSSAKIVSNGLLGDKYVNIEPGAEDEMLKQGGMINYTQSSINMEQLLGKFIFGSSQTQKTDKQNAQADH